MTYTPPTSLMAGLGRFKGPITIIVIYVVIGSIVFSKNPFDQGPDATPTWLLLSAGVMFIVVIAGLVAPEESNPTNRYMFIFKNSSVVIGALAGISALIYYGTCGTELQKSGVRLGVCISLILITIAVAATSGKVMFAKIVDLLGKSMIWFSITKWFSRTWYDIKRFIFIQQTGTRMWMKMILIGELLIVAGYFASPAVKRTLTYRGGTVLLGDKPVSLGKKRDLMLYDPKINKLVNLNEQHNELSSENTRTILFGTVNIPITGKDIYTYNYSISGWFYIVPGVHEETNILNYASRPSIVYDPTLSKLVVKTTAKPSSGSASSPDTFISNKEFPLQKWNHLVVNYDGGTLDIFMNNELIVSRKGTLSYDNTNLKLTVGGDTSIKGGVKSVVYYNKPNTRQDISRLYNNSMI